LERFKRWSVYTPAILVCLQPRLLTCRGVAPVFIKPAAIRPRKPPSVLSPFAQLRCYLRWGDVSVISSEGVTPPSSLLRAHVPLPLSSLLLRHLASLGESWQVVHSPCCPRELPDVISESLSLDAGSHSPAVHRVLSPVSSTMSSAFPKQGWVGFPHLSHELRLLARRVSRLQIFLYVPASKFAHPPDRSYRCDTAAGQPGLLHPGISCFVTSTRTGYANRLNPGN
jgi:hypothetical protein